MEKLHNTLTRVDSWKLTVLELCFSLEIPSFPFATLCFNLQFLYVVFLLVCYSFWKLTFWVTSWLFRSTVDFCWLFLKKAQCLQKGKNVKNMRKTWGKIRVWQVIVYLVVCFTIHWYKWSLPLLCSCLFSNVAAGKFHITMKSLLTFIYRKISRKHLVNMVKEPWRVRELVMREEDVSTPRIHRTRWEPFRWFKFVYAGPD
jgi:hypothetical protein